VGADEGAQTPAFQFRSSVDGNAGAIHTTFPLFGPLLPHITHVARPTALRPANEDSVALEVLIPPVLPRVKQSDERAALVHSGSVLARIAVVAGKSEVFRCRLFRHARLCTIPEIRKYGGPIRR